MLGPSAGKGAHAVGALDQRCLLIEREHDGDGTRVFVELDDDPVLVAEVGTALVRRLARFIERQYEAT